MEQHSLIRNCLSFDKKIRDAFTRHRTDQRHINQWALITQSNKIDIKASPWLQKNQSIRIVSRKLFSFKFSLQIASKMKVLKFSEKYLIYCGMYTYRNPTIIDKIFKFVMNFIFLGGITALWQCSSVYMYRNPNDVSNILNATLQLCAGILTTGTYFAIIFNEKKLKSMNRELQNIVDNGKSDNLLNLFFSFSKYLVIFQLKTRTHMKFIKPLKNETVKYRKEFCIFF